VPDDRRNDPKLVPDAGLEHDEALVAPSTPSPYRRALRRLLRDKPAVIALGFLSLLVLAAVFAPLVVPHSPNDLSVAPPFSKPSLNTPFGTDNLGRDVFSRIIYGARVSLSSGFEIVFLALLIAIPVGLLAGFRGGGTDNLLMRLMDALASFPPLVLALAVVAILGPGLRNAVLAIAIVVTPGFARLVRAQTLAVRQETFIEASRSMGTKPGRIRRTRVLPNVASPLIVAVSLAMGAALIAEASLSLLGYGVEPSKPSWGAMIQQGRSFIYDHPWQVFVPSVTLAITILAFNTLGDGLRDALGLGTPKGKRTIKGRLGLTTVDRADEDPEVSDAPTGRIGQGLLDVSELSVQFLTDSGPATVVDKVSFGVAPGEMIGIVGESGSGKTVTSLAVMRLVPSPPGRIVSGSVMFDDRDLLTFSLAQMREVRGNEIAMVFQDPMTSLNPAFTIGTQLVDTIRLHRKMSKREAGARAIELLEMVGISDPQARVKDYPHQLSGGMRQRALLALALSCEPRLLIADEPTTALDVTVQAQILDLLRTLQSKLGMAVILVTHDLGVIADLCSRVVVMYAGQVVEEASVEDLFAHPQHPYTEGLLAAIPQVAEHDERLMAIPGVVPDPTEMPKGCRFHPRCPYAIPECSNVPVELRVAGEQHRARCIRLDELSLKGAR
jgi:peptide/nickel transport system permease protein